MGSREVVEHNAALARDYLEWQGVRRNRSPETMVAYTRVLEKLLLWLGDTPLERVSLPTLERFVERPRQRRRPEHLRGSRITGSPATRKLEVTVLRTFFRYLHDRGHIRRNPTALLVGPTVRNVQPKAIPDEVWIRFWTSKLTDAERVAFGLGFYCGLRRRELVDLRPDHFDPSSARIVGFVRKGGLEDSFAYGSSVQLIGDRLPHLLPDGSAVFLDALERLLKVRAWHPYLLPWGDELRARHEAKGAPPLKDPYPAGWAPPKTVNNRLRAALRRCGMPERAFGVHALRHSAITNWLRCGVPLHVVSRLAAHGDVSTTMRYVSLSSDPLAELLAHGLLPRPQRWPTA